MVEKSNDQGKPRFLRLVVELDDDLLCALTVAVDAELFRNDLASIIETLGKSCAEAVDRYFVGSPA